MIEILIIKMIKTINFFYLKKIYIINIFFIDIVSINISYQYLIYNIYYIFLNLNFFQIKLF